MESHGEPWRAMGSHGEPPQQIQLMGWVAVIRVWFTSSPFDFESVCWQFNSHLLTR